MNSFQVSVFVSLKICVPKCEPACQVPNVPPVGSWTIVIRPRSITSIVACAIVPPFLVTASAVASASSVAR